MVQIVPVDVHRFVLDIHRDLSVSPRARKGGPPERIDGMTVGFVSVTGSAPHNGEVHADGDEILYVISGRLRRTALFSSSARPGWGAANDPSVSAKDPVA